VSALIASICVHSQSNQEEANSRANEGALKAIGYSATLRNLYGASEMNADDFNFSDEEYDWEYWKGIAFLVCIPLAFAGLSVLICPLWTLCRCCKCCCCKKKQPRKDVTLCSIYVPYFIIFASVVAVVAMVAMAYGANIDFSKALLTDEEGNLYGVAETLMSDGVHKAGTIQEITGDLRSGIIDAIDGVQSFLNDTDVLSVGSSSLITMLSSISALWSDYTIVTEHNGTTYEFECTFCETFSSEVAIISTQIETQVGPIFSDLNITVNEIDVSLVGVEAEIIAQVDAFMFQIEEVQLSLVETEGEVEKQREMVELHNGHRELAYNIIFAIPLIAIVFILFGGILKKPLCFSLSYVCLWFTCTLMWLLLAVHLPLAVLLNDACNFLDVADQNFSAVFPQTMDAGNASVGELFDACVADEGLTDTLGLSEFLNFTQQITFPSLGNISQEFQFTELIAFEDDAFSTNFTTFYATGDAALLTINNLTAHSPLALGGDGALLVHWDRSNVAALNSTAYYPINTDAQEALDELKGVLEAESLSIEAFSDTVERIQSNVSAVSAAAASIEADVQDLVSAVDNTSALLSPLFASVAEMDSEARCGFIGSAYRDTKAVMCSAVLGSLSRIVVSMLVIAFLSLFACLCSVKLVRRVEWWQTQKREEKEDKLQQSFQPNKQKIIVMQQQPQLGAYQPGGNHGHGHGHMPQSQGMYYNAQHL